LAKKNSGLEIIIAIGAVVFIFALVGILNIGPVEIMNPVAETASENPGVDEVTSEVSVIPSVELQPAISGFVVMGS
jgi:hypothetical protein